MIKQINRRLPEASQDNPLRSLEAFIGCGLGGQHRALWCAMPVHEDQHGELLDGNNRRRWARIHNKPCPRITVMVNSEKERT